MQCTGNSGCFPRGKRAAIVRRYPGIFSYPVSSVSVIHRTLTWTTGSLTCLCDHWYYVRIYIHTGTGVGHTADNESAQDFDSEKLAHFSCAPDGTRTSGLWISSRISTRHPKLYDSQAAVVESCRRGCYSISQVYGFLHCCRCLFSIGDQSHVVSFDS